MSEFAAVWVIIARFTVMGYGGDALPEGRYRVAFTSEADCRKEVPAVRRSFNRSALPVKPDSINCEKLEIRK